jgi:hypothetical protein
VSTVVDLLFDEFAIAWARGDRPDVRDYLERAGAERDELAALLDGFFAAAAVQPPSEETLATFAQLVPGDHETPPMLAERVRMGLRRSVVVERLMGLLGLPPDREDKVARYYHELETGLLDPRGVQPLVWHNLAKIFGSGIRGLMVERPEPPPVLVAAYYRVSDDLAGVDASAAPLPQASEPQQPDEVDMLFTGNA